MSKMPIARSKVSTTTTNRNMTSHQIVSITNSNSFRDSFEEYSTKSPSRMLFLKDSALKMSPGWVSGHASLFKSPKSPSPKAVNTYRSSVYTKKTSTSSTSVDVFKKPGAVFISPTGVKTRARRSSIYHKSGKNLLAGLTGKSRRDSLAAVRSKKLVSESDYVFSVPKTDTSGRRKLVSKKNKTAPSTASAKKPSIIRSPSPKKSTTKSKSPPKTRSKLKSNCPLKISSLKVKLAVAEPSKKTTRKILPNVGKPSRSKSKSSPVRPSTKDVTVTIATSSMKRALPEKSPTKQSPPKKSKIVKSSSSEVNLMDDDEEGVTEEETVFSPRRTRKTPGKKIKRSLSSVNKGAKKRRRSPSKSPSPAKKKSISVKSKSPASSKKRKITKSPSTKNKNSISSRKNSLEVSLIPFEAESFTNLKISDSDKKKLATPSKKSTETTSKRRISMKTSSKTSSSLSTPLHDSSPKMTPTRNKTPSIKTETHTSSSSNAPKTPIITSMKTTKPKSSAKKTTSTPKSSQKTLLRRSLQSSSFDLKASDELLTVTKSIDDVEPVSTTDALPKSKTPLSTIKMKSILDSVTSLTNAEDKKRKTRDLAEPQSANKRRFEKIVASTPRDMRLDILSGRRPELSPITNSVNKNINNSMKQITVFSDKSTFLSTGPSNLSPVAAHSPLRFNVSDEVHGRTDDDEDDVFDYSNITCSGNPVMSKPYLFDYDTELDTSHSNIRSGCTIL